MSRCVLTLLLAVVALLAAACATVEPHLDRSRALASEGLWEGALAELEAGVKESERSHQYRVALTELRLQAIGQLLRDANELRLAGRHEDAIVTYERVLRLQPAELRASAGLQHIAADRRRMASLEEAEKALSGKDVAAAEKAVKAVLVEDPRNAKALALARRLEARRPHLSAPVVIASLMRKPITLEFRDANLKMVFDVISRASGINFVLDKDIRPDAKTSIFVKNSPIEDAIESLLATNQLGKKVLNENSVLVYPNTPQKVKDYQDLVIRNFFLQSADAKQMMSLLKTILKTRDVYIDEKRNLLVIRDTPEAVLLAERLITAHDQAEPEVMLEVEILEVGRTRTNNIGIKFPDTVGLGVIDPITVQQLRNLNSAGVNVTGLGSALALNLKKLFSDVDLLANPRIRVRNKEKAKIHVGDRVPVISSSVSTTTAISAQAVSYLDVGIKLEVEPQILDDDVMIKISLEVSSLGAQATVQNSIAYTVGTRNAQTTLTLKDGETQILAGLISDNSTETTNKLPGLGEVPFLGRLFSNRNSSIEKREVILSITPRIVRRLERPDAALAEYWSGPESNIRSVATAAISPPALPAAVPRPSGAPTGGSGAAPAGSGDVAGRAAPVSAAGAAPLPAATVPTAEPASTSGAQYSAPGSTPAAPFIFQPPPGVGTN